MKQVPSLDVDKESIRCPRRSDGPNGYERGPLELLGVGEDDSRCERQKLEGVLPGRLSRGKCATALGLDTLSTRSVSLVDFHPLGVNFRFLPPGR